MKALTVEEIKQTLDAFVGNCNAIMSEEFRQVAQAIHNNLPERLSKITEENLRGALARGYCPDRNKHKTLDSDLLDDCFNAVWEYLKEKG